jgi:transposase|nr:MAG TPA: MerR HTH family regulatory protein [Caudoviricetes sp.]
MSKIREYSIYKGEKEIFVGTIEEVMKHFNVKKETVYFWATPANKKRADTGIRTGRKPRKKEQSGVKVAVRLWEDNE